MRDIQSERKLSAQVQEAHKQKNLSICPCEKHFDRKNSKYI